MLDLIKEGMNSHWTTHADEACPLRKELILAIAPVVKMDTISSMPVWANEPQESAAAIARLTVMLADAIIAEMEPTPEPEAAE